jgi:hypothetical protein
MTPEDWSAASPAPMSIEPTHPFPLTGRVLHRRSFEFLPEPHDSATAMVIEGCGGDQVREAT